MTEIIKETITTQGNVAAPATAPATVVVTDASPENTASSSQTIEYLIYFFFGAVNVLLAFRLVLKLLGANPSSGFVNMLYTLTGILTFPFAGIFHKGYTQGIDTTAVLEPATIVAIVVYAFAAWGIVQLLRILTGQKKAE
jgi:hypothetical protein